MTEAQDTSDRRVMWLRRIGRVLALIWAALWMLMLLWTVYWQSELYPSFGQWIATFSVGSWLTLAVWVLIPWVSIAVTWRREALGGVMLVLAGLLSSLRGWPILLAALPGYRIHIGWTLPMIPVALASALVAPWLASAAGILFLASWWKSRASEGP
jgi:hypothetical protein